MPFNQTNHHSLTRRGVLTLGLLVSLLLLLPHGPAHADDLDYNANYSRLPLLSQAELKQLIPNDAEVIDTAAIELVQNGNFEAGRNGDWVTSSHYFDRLIYNTDSSPPLINGFVVTPHSGTYAAVLGDPPANAGAFEDSRVWQKISIPPAITATLTYHYQIVSNDTCGDDFGFVKVKQLFSPAEKVAIHNLCQEDETSGWTKASIDLTEYSGQTIYLMFEARLGRDNFEPVIIASSFLLDDISLNVEPKPTISLPFKVFLPVINQSPDLECNSSGGSGGLTPGTYDTTVAGLKAIVIVGSGYNPQTPTRLAFYLHGDGGDYDSFSSPSDQIKMLVDQKGWVYVAPLSQIPQETDYSSWSTAPDLKEELLAAVFEEMFAKYNLCRNGVLGSGASGGSYFYSRWFFPDMGDLYPAFVNLNCGAGAPLSAGYDWVDIDDKINILSQQEKIISLTRLKYTYGSEDFLFDSIQNSLTLFNQSKFVVIKDEIDGAGHCAFDLDSKTSDFWKSVANERGW